MGNFGSKSKKSVKDSSSRLKSESFNQPKKPIWTTSSLHKSLSYPTSISTISSSSSSSSSPSSSPPSSPITPKPKPLPRPAPTIPSEDRRIEAFELLKTLGTGCYGRVMLARHRATGAHVAIKILKKTEVVRKRQIDHVRDELRMLKEVQECAHVVQLLAAFQDAKNLYLVMEYVNGGELFVHLRRANRFSEEIARFYAAEVILAWDHLHSKNIIHRDLKPENLLLTHDGHVKITDFGFAKRLKDGVAWTVCGTPEYLAPENILSKGYGKAADWWALGVLLFEMLTGHSPFYDEDPYRVHEKIVAGKLEYPAFLKPIAKDLISKLLTADLSQRLGNLKDGSEDIKKHPFFSGIDWEALKRREVVAPFAPGFRGEGDSSHFLRYPEDQEVAPGPNDRDLFACLFPDF